MLLTSVSNNHFVFSTWKMLLHTSYISLTGSLSTLCLKAEHSCHFGEKSVPVCLEKSIHMQTKKDGHFKSIHHLKGKRASRIISLLLLTDYQNAPVIFRDHLNKPHDRTGGAFSAICFRLSRVVERHQTYQNKKRTIYPNLSWVPPTRPQ